MTAMPPMLIDTHCHLAHGKLRGQVDGVLGRAEAEGVGVVIAAAADLHESKAALGLARSFPGVFCMAGIHPHDAKDASPEALRQIADLAAQDRCVAVGEIGLDYHYDFSPRQAQREAFAAQLEIAARLAAPVVIHTREAFDDTLAILDAWGGDMGRVLFHSFTGGPDEARQVVERGAWLSYSGIATFRNADAIRESVRLTPADRLCVETDAPFLSPEPVRKIQTNEPAHVVHTARRLADVRREPFDDFAARTTRNAIAFFGLDVNPG